MKRPNLRIIDIEESEDSQLKGPVNIFNKIIEENFSDLKKDMPMNIKKPTELQIERILKSIREKGQVTYKGRSIRITPEFSPETMKVRRSWTDVIQTLREHKCQPGLL
jgi:hypothetical protein